ncbi:MAG TPA: glycosyltransferase [Flavobacterium sp.]|nr:glycosyltransferase [Flavobacterium sp.]
MKVSICMITYNHEKYIDKAINGVLNQKTSFDIELIIANDNSTDFTDSIVKNIIKNHPSGDKIIYLNNPTNIGMMPNFIQTLTKSTGEYIALCEGDDYWTDDQKLQKQVDFLDINPDYSICFHKVSIDKNGEIIDDNITPQVNLKTSIYDLAKVNYIHTCSVVYRNHLFESFPDYFHISPIGDYFLHLLNSRFGFIHYIDENMANYRVHTTSYWSSKQQEDREKIWISFIENIKYNFDDKVQKLLQKQVDKLIYNRKSKIEKIIFKLFN